MNRCSILRRRASESLQFTSSTIRLAVGRAAAGGDNSSRVLQRSPEACSEPAFIDWRME